MKIQNINLLLVGSYISYSQGSFSVGEDLANALTSKGLTIHMTSRQRRKIFRLLDILITTWRLRSEINLALVELYSGPAFIWAEACCRLMTRFKIPYILTLHGGNLPQFAGKHPRRVKRLLRSAAAITAPSPYLIQALKSFCSGIQWIPNPLNLENYIFRARGAPQPLLTWLRAFHQIYNPSMAIRTLAILAQEYPAVQLRMVGPDKGEGSLGETLRLASELGVQDHLEIYGPTPKADVPGVLQCGDIFLNTTNYDNTPVSVLEAMACGLSVVSTNVGGIPYLLAHEVDSLLVPPNDAQAMASAVRRLLNEPGLAACLAQNARRKVEQFDWEFILPKWLDLITNAISQNPSGENANA